mmetsp:Transcript_14759/g.43326  ORF Transcript_14759/g.43326 Transcript_14759/m.43326 type:complete len:238 (-) Transcript_14759:486-1199(-)
MGGPDLEQPAVNLAPRIIACWMRVQRSVKRARWLPLRLPRCGDQRRVERIPDGGFATTGVAARALCPRSRRGHAVALGRQLAHGHAHHEAARPIGVHGRRGEVGRELPAFHVGETLRTPQQRRSALFAQVVRAKAQQLASGPSLLLHRLSVTVARPRDRDDGCLDPTPRALAQIRDEVLLLLVEHEESRFLVAVQHVHAEAQERHARGPVLVGWSSVNAQTRLAPPPPHDQEVHLLH